MDYAIALGETHRPSDLHGMALRHNPGGGAGARNRFRAAIDAALGAATELGIRTVEVLHPRDAPSDLQQLNDALIPRMRPPYPGSPATTLEGYHVPVAGIQDPATCSTFWGEAGNALFRAIHDTLHYRGQHDFDQTGEWYVCKQELALYSRHVDDDHREFVRKLVESETWGQTGFHAITGKFPEDQLLFLYCYMATGNPKDATYRYLSLI